MNCSWVARVWSWDELSSLLASSLLSELAHKLTTAGYRGEQSGRFMRGSLTHAQPYPFWNAPRTLSYTFGTTFVLYEDAKTAMHFCANQSYVLGQKNRGKPLRLVHRKVLRNWQVNCAMHAWAMQLGERSTQDLAIKTFYRHLHIIWLDVNFITGIKKMMSGN